MNLLKKIHKKVNINEGVSVIENILVELYLKGNLSTKMLSKIDLLPLPIVSAIKKELIKAGLLEQKIGVSLSMMGMQFVENKLGYHGFNAKLYLKIMNDDHSGVIDSYKTKLIDIFENRPSVDVTLDQAKCTIDTSTNRAMLCLKNKTLVNKKILCLGDDDLVSVSLAFLLKELFNYNDDISTEIVVFEKDIRIVNYINYLVKQWDLPIKCFELDIRKKIPKQLCNYFDIVFIDPPYTLSGVNLFVSRGVQALKKEKDLSIYLSYAKKSCEQQLEIQDLFTTMRLTLSDMIANFNQYEGASILGSVGQMMVLKTTDASIGLVKEEYSVDEKLYTYDFNNNVRIYHCINCNHEIKVGKNHHYNNIEELKHIGCSKCGFNKFNLTKKEKVINNKLENKGDHIILDMYECDIDIIKSVKSIKKIMLQAAIEANAHIVISEFHQFNPWGVSGVVIIKESHLTIHTWPEYGYAAVDIFTCGTTLDIDGAIKYLRSTFNTKKIRESKMIRKLTY